MIFHDVQQNTEEWMALRIGKVTASKYATIMAHYGKDFGEPAKHYALQLALERLNGKVSENNYSNEHMERGHEQEPIAKALYEVQHFVDVTNGGFFDHGEYGDSPDGLVRSDGVIEVKSVIDKVHWATVQRGSYDPAYHWQLVGHLDATGRDWVDFVSYCADFPKGGQIFVHRLEREDYAEDLAKLRSRREQFIELVHLTKDDVRKRIF